MKAVQNEGKPAAVPKAKQGGETEDRWGWVERAVWTKRMWKALETGVKGGVWFSVMDTVYRLRNLRAAFRKVKANRGSTGVDPVTVERFEKRLEGNLWRQHLRGSGRLGARPTSRRTQGSAGPQSRSRPSKLAQHFFPRARVVLLNRSLRLGDSTLYEVNHQLESRLRENWTAGSEGGVPGTQPSVPTPSFPEVLLFLGRPALSALDTRVFATTPYA